MVFKVKFSEQATDDLDGIIAYIEDELYNPQAAERFYNLVNKKRALLREHPYMFPLCPDEKLRAEGYRSVVIGNFIMFYLVDDDKSVVNIARILYRRRDIPSAFNES